MTSTGRPDRAGPECCTRCRDGGPRRGRPRSRSTAAPTRVTCARLWQLRQPRPPACPGRDHWKQAAHESPRSTPFHGPLSGGGWLLNPLTAAGPSLALSNALTHAGRLPIAQRPSASITLPSFAVCAEAKKTKVMAARGISSRSIRSSRNWATRARRSSSTRGTLLLHTFAFGIAPSMTRAPDRNRGRRHSDISSSSDALTYTSRNDMRSPVKSQYKSFVFHPRRTRGALDAFSPERRGNVPLTWRG
jgi:hypothetical protein